MSRTVLLLVATLGLLGTSCQKEQTPTTQPTGPTAKPEDDLDKAATLLVRTLLTGEYDELRDNTVNPLTHDLSKEEFADLSKVIQWLGVLEDRTETKTDMSHGGGQRWYTLQFEKGSPVDLEVSLDGTGKLIGFQFSGDGYTEAERGVLAEPFREFKVYDFFFLGPNGEELDPGAPIAGNKVNYDLVVGGIEAFVGEHHISVRMTVLDAKGGEVFVMPVEFDTKFAADAMGVPRGDLRGSVEVPGPGDWELLLRVTDEHAHRTVDSSHKFTTVAAK